MNKSTIFKKINLNWFCLSYPSGCAKFEFGHCVWTVQCSRKFVILMFLFIVISTFFRATLLIDTNYKIGSGVQSVSTIYFFWNYVKLTFTVFLRCFASFQLKTLKPQLSDWWFVVCHHFRGIHAHLTVEQPTWQFIKWTQKNTSLR